MKTFIDTNFKGILMTGSCLWWGKGDNNGINREEKIHIHIGQFLHRQARPIQFLISNFRSLKHIVFTFVHCLFLFYEFNLLK